MSVSKRFINCVIWKFITPCIWKLVISLYWWYYCGLLYFTLFILTGAWMLVTYVCNICWWWKQRSPLQQWIVLTYIDVSMTSYVYNYVWLSRLTHWGLVTHICVSKLGSDKAIIWTNTEILLIARYWEQTSVKINRNIHIFIQENAIENVVRKSAVMLSRPHFCCNKYIWLSI